MFVGQFKSVDDERQKKRNQKNILKLMIDNERKIERKVKDYQNPFVAPEVPPQYKSRTERVQDSATQDADALANLQSLFEFDVRGYNKVMRAIRETRGNDGVVIFNALFPQIRNKIVNETNPNLLTPAFVADIVREFIIRNEDTNPLTKIKGESVSKSVEDLEVDYNADVIRELIETGRQRNMADTQLDELAQLKRFLDNFSQLIQRMKNDGNMTNDELESIVKKIRTTYKKLGVPTSAQARKAISSRNVPQSIAKLNANVKSTRVEGAMETLAEQIDKDMVQMENFDTLQDAEARGTRGGNVPMSYQESAGDKALADVYQVVSGLGSVGGVEESKEASQEALEERSQPSEDFFFPKKEDEVKQYLEERKDDNEKKKQREKEMIKKLATLKTKKQRNEAQKKLEEIAENAKLQYEKALRDKERKEKALKLKQEAEEAKRKEELFKKFKELSVDELKDILEDTESDDLLEETETDTDLDIDGDLKEDEESFFEDSDLDIEGPLSPPTAEEEELRKQLAEGRAEDAETAKLFAYAMKKGYQNADEEADVINTGKTQEEKAEQVRKDVIKYVKDNYTNEAFKNALINSPSIGFGDKRRLENALGIVKNNTYSQVGMEDFMFKVLQAKRRAKLTTKLNLGRQVKGYRGKDLIFVEQTKVNKKGYGIGLPPDRTTTRLRKRDKELEFQAQLDQIPRVAFKKRVGRPSVKIGKGIDIEVPQDNYKTFGKHLIHYPSLRDDYKVSIKYPSRSKNVGKVMVVSPDYREMVMDLLERGGLSDRLYDKLSNDEKKHFNQAVKASGLMETLKLKPIDEDKKDLVERFKVLRGEFIAGNDAPSMLKELRSLVLYFMENGQIPKTQGYDLLKELASVEK